MYIKMTIKDFKDLKKNLPDDISLWLTKETINSLKVNIHSEDFENVKAILYRNFLEKNPSFLNVGWIDLLVVIAIIGILVTILLRT